MDSKGCQVFALHYTGKEMIPIVAGILCAARLLDESNLFTPLEDRRSRPVEKVVRLSVERLPHNLTLDFVLD